ncbi:MAG: hypothetical protein QW057_00255 [Candidatus Bathyarchaeia archaeon]
MRGLWWQTLVAAIGLNFATVGYYWSAHGSAASGLASAVQDYIANWPVVAMFFVLTTVSTWLRLRVVPDDAHDRIAVMNSAALVSVLLGSCSLISALGILALQVSWPSPWAILEALSYPPMFVSGSSSLIVAGLALAFASWPLDKARILMRTLGRIGLLAVLGFLPLIVWAEVHVLRLQLQTAAAIGLLILIVALVLLLVSPTRAKAGGRKVTTGGKATAAASG